MTYLEEEYALNSVGGFRVVSMGTKSDAHKCDLDKISREALGITIPWNTVIQCDHCGQMWEWLRKPTRREFNWQKFRWEDIIGEPYWKEYGTIWMF